mgnify:FL=1
MSYPNNTYKYVLAVDAGTTSSRVALVSRDGKIVRLAQEELRQFFPHNGWVEEEPAEIKNSVISLIRKILASGISPEEIGAIGIANQRETTLVWSRETGEAIYPAIVWQCRRTASYCELLKEQGLEKKIREKTGLVIDAYFSATKLRWILDNVEGARSRAERGELCFGTVDSWLLWHLSGGRLHVTDHSNASRTLLYNAREGCWDKELLELFAIPESVLPEIVSHDETIGGCDPSLFGREIMLSPALGDQQAALFGQLCFSPGSSKNTYGTGGFLLVNNGSEFVLDKNGLLTTVAWRFGDESCYALEGSVFIAGAAVKWLQDKLGLIDSAGETERLAQSVPDTGGCYLVPAFSGLGAPHWDPYARGLLIGITQDTSRAHLVRATLEAIAYQTEDILALMRQDLSREIELLRVDGGASRNDFLLQFQADISGLSVERSGEVESTVRGAAFLAGLRCGLWPDRESLCALPQEKHFFRPHMKESKRQALLAGWERAVERAKGWTAE